MNNLDRRLGTEYSRNFLGNVSQGLTLDKNPSSPEQRQYLRETRDWRLGVVNAAYRSIANKFGRDVARKIVNNFLTLGNADARFGGRTEYLRNYIDSLASAGVIDPRIQNAILEVWGSDYNVLFGTNPYRSGGGRVAPQPAPQPAQQLAPIKRKNEENRVAQAKPPAASQGGLVQAPRTPSIQPASFIGSSKLPLTGMYTSQPAQTFNFALAQRQAPQTAQMQPNNVMPGSLDYVKNFFRQQLGGMQPGMQFGAQPKIAADDPPAQQQNQQPAQPKQDQQQNQQPVQPAQPARPPQQEAKPQENQQAQEGEQNKAEEELDKILDKPDISKGITQSLSEDPYSYFGTNIFANTLKGLLDFSFKPLLVRPYTGGGTVRETVSPSSEEQAASTLPTLKKDKF